MRIKVIVLEMSKIYYYDTLLTGFFVKYLVKTNFDCWIQFNLKVNNQNPL